MRLQNIAPKSAERAIQVAASLIDLARIENKVPPTVRRQKICFDEWNVWDPVRAPGEQGAEEKYGIPPFQQRYGFTANCSIQVHTV